MLQHTDPTRQRGKDAPRWRVGLVCWRFTKKGMPDPYMHHELIGSWLQLPQGSWPPDHYTLLGLSPGETDVARIEHQVNERMELVRRYQLIHPEPASEAMNRLAKALICLTDPVAK